MHDDWKALAEVQIELINQLELKVKGYKERESNVKEMQDVLSWQAELLSKQYNEIVSLKEQVEALVDTINWYESETLWQEKVEQLQSLYEKERAERVRLEKEVSSNAHGYQGE